jgi:hypothetical protein
MVLDPGTAMLIAAAVSTAAQGAGQGIAGGKAKKAAKLRSKELERETAAGNLGESMQRQAELHGHKLSRRAHLGKRKAQNYHDTASMIRGALAI